MEQKVEDKETKRNEKEKNSKRLKTGEKKAKASLARYIHFHKKPLNALCIIRDYILDIKNKIHQKESEQNAERGK